MRLVAGRPGAADRGLLPDQSDVAAGRAPVRISKSAAGRVVDHLAPHLALAPVRRKHSPDTVLIVDGTLVPVHDRRMSACSKNYRYSANMQVVIDANTRLTVAVGEPLPGNRNDCRAFTESGVDRACDGAQVMADGGCQGNPSVIMPYRKPRDRQRTPAMEASPQHCPQTCPRSRGTRPGAHEVLERAAQLPP
jgi:hypothetical protein